MPGVRGSYQGHRRSWVLHNNDRYFVLIPHKDAEVHGVILQVTTKDLQRCDGYESRYNRRKVRLQSGESAWMYKYKYPIVEHA
jgi:gamma-glutamylcyclotransferase (GGCT)/AIG2-like uncharacterized protein YtfP